ncbi:MAG: DNA gyrase C-terminal beta-propeller domain-containing protein, partial [Actinomycetota bacterium]
LSVIQAQYILDTPLRRLTRFDKLELEKEGERLREEIGELTAILESESRLRALVSAELASVSKSFSTPRRTVLLEGNGGGTRTAAVPLEVADDPCTVLLSSAGLLARTAARPADVTDGAGVGAGGAGVAGDGQGTLDVGEPAASASGPAGGSGGGGQEAGPRLAHDAIVSAVPATARGTVGVVTSLGRLIRLGVLELPALPPSAHSPGLAGGAAVSEFVGTEPGETVVAIVAAEGVGAGLALGTAAGVVKRVALDYPASADDFEVISLKDDDRVIGAVQLASEDDDLVFVTSDAQLLRFGASAVRPQGRAAGGMAGIRLAAGASVVWFGAVAPADVPSAVVVTVAGSAGALPGTTAATVKVSPYSEFPPKGRATGGVRCHRFLKGEDTLVLAWAGAGPARGASDAGTPVELPAADGRRDGSGERVRHPLAAIGGSAPPA